jgi:hypothetical protein
VLRGLHYRHDPSRNGRRNVIVDAYGNEVEFVDAIRRLTEELDQWKVALVENRALEFLGRL